MSLCFKLIARLAIVTAALKALAACAPQTTPPVLQADRFWKGNLHTHSFWSDGDTYPEMVADWYKSSGYHFLAISDHNVLAIGERFLDTTEQGGGELLDAYRKRFGEDWVEEREGENGNLEVKLKTLEEYRTLFEEPDAFLLLQAEEITENFDSKPIHVNATNIVEFIEPPGGDSVTAVMQNILDAVAEQRARTGQPMFPHINHPNYRWALTIEDLLALEGDRFFEVYNGHPRTNNDGDADRPSTEVIWDHLLTARLKAGRDPVYGIAVDDAHNYHAYNADNSNPGRGWVMVRAASLTAEALIEAMEAGDFYGSSGVELTALEATQESLSFTIAAEPGVTYQTEFVGSFRDSDAIGEVLAKVEGATPRYHFQGDELYLRAKVISSKLKDNPYREGETEAAWIQPVTPGR